MNDKPLPPLGPQHTTMVQPTSNFQLNPVNAPAITVQPGLQGQLVWMMRPKPIHGVPAGLEYLTVVDTLTVHQLYEIRELLLNYESKNKYVLRNANGEQVYYAFEESSLCQRLCCGPNREFTIHIVDNFNSEVIRVTRPFKCFGGGCCGIFACFECCSTECQIEAPPGNVIGYVKQRRACCASSFHIMDAEGNSVLTIDGPCCCLACGCHDINFPVTTPSNAEIGNIAKRWGGFIREALTDADVFKVSFPMDLDVKVKALLLAATFLIDFMEFEQQPKNRQT
ncbi:hypothetical protein Q1695_008187 [Nippostrongylus brasiliensis]|nr:hypothetical protein Q1695_008187 [Nippostrongylus brasiliensis]